MIVLETIARRWYALGFIALLVWAVLPAGGWRRAARFLAVAAGISLAAELASTRTGFPYGRYTYVAGTSGQELYIANVPLFVPISFGTVVWAGRSLAVSALPRAGPAARIAAGALGAAVLDLVIDPMTLRGEEWFLGRLYEFASSGFFGVPWSNFGGWVLVSGTILALDEALERASPRSPTRGGGNAAERRGLVLAFTITGFFVAIALATRQWFVAASGAALTGALAGAVALGRTRPWLRARASE